MFRRLSLAAALIGCAVVAATAMAQSLDEQREALREARAEAKQAEKRSATLKRQATAALTEADRLSAEAAALTAEIDKAEADVEAAEARVAIIRELQKRQTYRLAEQQEPLVRLTAALQKIARRPTIIALFEPRSMEEIIHVRAAMRHILPEVQKRTKKLRAEVDRSRELRQQLSQSIASLRQGQKDLADRKAELARLSNEQRGNAEQLTADAGLEADRALAMGERSRDILDNMDVLRDSAATRGALAELDGPVLRPKSIGRKAPRQTSDAYRLPVSGTLVMGLGEESGSGYRARGLTLRAEPNESVVAPAAGRITYAGPYRGFGSIVIIRHDANWTTLVAQLGDLRIEKGMDVAKGGLIGVTNEDNPEITVELRRKGRPVDIAALIG